MRKIIRAGGNHAPQSTANRVVKHMESNWTRRTFLSAMGVTMVPRQPLLVVPQQPLFAEQPARGTGITWTHDNAFSVNRHLPETMGPGCAFLDYDNDGWMDIFLVNSGPSDFYHPTKPPQNALYKNNRDGTFTNVTHQAGLTGGTTFGMGVAVGDYNNDGFPDLFVTAYGRSLLYRNNGNGTFTEVSRQAGVEVDGFTTSAVWFDYDNDGLLDLFVCGFVDYSPAHRRRCGDDNQARYCIPRGLPPSSSKLFRNRGDGTFEDVTAKSGIGKTLGKSLGVVAVDFNNDGHMDLFVANDTDPNFLFRNRGDGTFEECAFPAGVALSMDGIPRSGMGVDAADFDGDGFHDLFVANIDREIHALYRNQGNGIFFEESMKHDIARATYPLSGWGLKFFDFDNDGTLDLIVANGHPDDRISDDRPSVTHAEPLLLFRQDGRRFHNITPLAGPAFAKHHNARGLALGDFNNDGRVDVLIGVNGGAPVLLRNQASPANNWLGLKLTGTKCNRDAIGARITWHAARATRSMRKNAGGSYLSSHDPRVVLGLGQATHADWVEIEWPAPSRAIQRIDNPQTRGYLNITEP